MSIDRWWKTKVTAFHHNLITCILGLFAADKGGHDGVGMFPLHVRVDPDLLYTRHARSLPLHHKLSLAGE